MYTSLSLSDYVYLISICIYLFTYLSICLYLSLMYI